ncbi:MAG: ABC-type uncharacterized transport system substrate-binding protein [Desulforhopalus sp.]|jgi:ABC-type uncharacterized transport system substrate-binding protein
MMNHFPAWLVTVATGMLKLYGIMILLLSVLFCGEAFAQEGRQFKVLHIMSYHSPWKWTDDQFNGFKYALKDLDVEYKVLQMDAKRKSSKESMEEVAMKAREIINTWKPDLVYTNDDAAQKHIVKHYVNSATPFVFSGVNINPIQYGFLGSKNVTGVMEQEHFIETVKLLQKIVPSVRKIAVIFDDAPTWEGVGGRMLAKLPQLKDINVTRWSVIGSFKEYKQLVQELQTEVDAIALLGIFGFKDEDGKPVPYTDVLRWTAENSNLPDFSFWKDRISYGTLCSVTVSGYEQGLAAGILAYRILHDGISPASLTMAPSVKGEPVLSLARAKKLGINVEADILLTSEVVTEFKWDSK